MRTVQEIYTAYRILPSLQLHQLRVAAVAKTLCDNLTKDVDERSLVLACLFHDMGNIIKSDLTVFPEFLEPEGMAHWQFIKDDFVRIYGNDEHRAAMAIAREIGLPPAALDIIDAVGFSKLGDTKNSNSFERKIIEYSDLRVAPHGVLTMTARIQEAQERYAEQRSDIPRNKEMFEELAGAAYEVEKQIFAEATISPDDITERSIRPLIEELRDYRVA